MISTLCPTTEAHTVTHEIGHAGRDDENEHQATGLMMEGAPARLPGQIPNDHYDDDTIAKLRGLSIS